MSVPTVRKERCTAVKVEGAERRRCEDQRGVEEVKVILWGGEPRVVPRPPSRRRIGSDIVNG